MIIPFNSTAQTDLDMTIYKFKVTNIEGDIFDVIEPMEMSYDFPNKETKCKN